MKLLLLLLLLLFLPIRSSGQSLDNIQKTIDSLKVIKNNILIRENPLRIKKLQNEIDSINLEKNKYLGIIEKLDKQLLEKESQIQAINYEAALISSENIKVIPSFRIPFYSEPNPVLSAKIWVESNSEIILLGYDHSTFVEYVKINYKGSIGYISLGAIQDDKSIKDLVNEFVERNKKRTNKIEKSYKSTNSDPTTDSYIPTTNNSSHYYHTGPRGGQYYINKNGNKTYRKRK